LKVLDKLFTKSYAIKVWTKYKVFLPEILGMELGIVADGEALKFQETLSTENQNLLSRLYQLKKS